MNKLAFKILTLVSVEMRIVCIRILLPSADEQNSRPPTVDDHTVVTLTVVDRSSNVVATLHASKVAGCNKRSMQALDVGVCIFYIKRGTQVCRGKKKNSILGHDMGRPITTTT